MPGALRIAASTIVALAPFASASADPGPASAMTCCDLRSVERIAAEYLELVDALSAGRSPHAECYALAGVLRAAAIDPRVADAERARIEVLVEQIDRAKDADAAVVRERLPAWSSVVVELVGAHAGGELRLALAGCGERVWLQRADAPADPDGSGCAAWR